MESKKAHVETKVTAAQPGFVRNPLTYVIALAVIVVVVFSGFLFSDNMLYSSDQIAGLDAKVFMRTSLDEHHQFPFWFSSRLGGLPTIDAMFGDAFYPPSIIINALFPVHRAIGLKMILHIFLAGLFFFLMMYRGFKVAAPIAFAGGVFYMLNPEFFSHIYPGHDGKMYVISLVPLMVWQLKALADAPRLLNATLLGLGIGMSLLTSHVQLTYFVLWGLFCYAVFAGIRFLQKKDRAGALRLAGYFPLAVCIGMAIGFISFFPSFMYVREAFSVRGVDRGFEYASSWSLHWPEVFSLWVPEFGNTLKDYWSNNPFKLNSEYAGGIVLMIAVIAVIWKRKPWRFFWAGVALFALLYSLGANTPFFQICYAVIPGVKKFRACSMIMFWFSFSTILLSLLFLKDMLAGELLMIGEKQKKQWTKGLLIAMAGVLGLALFFSLKDAVTGFFPFISAMDTQKRQIFDANFTQNFVPMLWLWLFFAIGVLAVILSVMQGKLKPGVAIWIIMVIGAVDVLRVDAQFIKVINPRPYFYTEPALARLKGEMTRGAPFRVFALPGALSQNGEGVQRLEGVGGFHDNELRWYREFRGDQQDRNYFDKLLGFTPQGQAYLKAEQIDKGNAFLGIANVKYLLGRNGQDLMVIENKNALGRVSFAQNFVVLDSSKIVSALQRDEYNYRTTVALHLRPMGQIPPAMTDSQALLLPPLKTEWQRYTPNDRMVKVAVPGTGFLRISEVYYPGWSIFVDDKKVPVLRADLAWMAVPITKGDHTVRMRVTSLYFGKAIWITCFIIVALCLYWAGVLVIGRKRRPTAVKAA